jgi:hypothetical protein
MDKVALEQVFSVYFGFPCQSSFHQFLHNHPHLSSGAGTIQYASSGRSAQSPTAQIKKKEGRTGIGTEFKEEMSKIKNVSIEGSGGRKLCLSIEKKCVYTEKFI